MMPFLAILRNDLRMLAGSWLVRSWLVAAAALTLLLAALAWHRFQTAPLIASLLLPWLVFPWFVLVMMLGVNPISGSRAEALADGFLSRPITRYEYLWAIWAARIIVVLGVYLLIMVPAICVAGLANRPVPADRVTLYGVIAAMAVVALVLTLQVSLAFLAGTLLRRALPAVAVLLFLWYPVDGLLHAFKLEAFSPISLSQAMPTLLREPWPGSGADASQAPSDLEIEELSRQTRNFLSLFSGGGSQEPTPPRRAGFFEHEEYRDFSLIRVLLGYGIPTLASIGLATVCFCRRDV